MNLPTLLFISTLICGLTACTGTQPHDQQVIPPKGSTADLEIDHLNIWVTNPTTSKRLLTDIGFTSVPDSLSAIHAGQGTSGRYFHFLNGYLELIFVIDEEELLANNEQNQALDFVLRANAHQNGASPFSMALKLRDYDIDKIPFDKVTYHQSWMEDEASIYSAKSSKSNPQEPSIFVVYPEIESGTYASMTALDDYPTDTDSWKAYYKHPNGAQSITDISITSIDLDLTSETMRAVKGIENLSITRGDAHLMELHFDNDRQGKTFDLRPELPLIVYL